jgi:hypothetical protein
VVSKAGCIIGVKIEIHLKQGRLEGKIILIFWSKIELFLNASILLEKNTYVYALDVQLVVW